MNQSAKIAIAAAGGYVLGRRKKFKLAIALGLYVAGRQLKLDPQRITGLLIERLGDSPQLLALREQAQGQLATVGKAAASAIVDRQAGRVADALQARTERLTGDGSEEPAEDEAEEPDEDASGDGGKRRSSPRRSGGTSRRRATAGSEA